MNCKNHPERQAVAICQKHQAGYCRECCDCQDLTECCGCSDPNLYCKFRSQCLIWELSRSRRKAGGQVMQNSKTLEGLEQEIKKLKAELDDRKAALPMHDATPQQWMVIEELEDEISQKKKELRNLKK